ncbi:site-specific integrase [Geodermatophilus sp. URMC 60]
MGTFGKIHFEGLGKHRVQAAASFRDSDGRRRQVLRTGPTRAQAERRLREALRDRATAGSPPLPADSRLSAMATLWLADVDASELASGTTRLYRFVVHSYVLPAVGELRLRELTVSAVDRLLATVHADHGPAAAKFTRSVLSGILGLAVRHGLLPTNPVRDATARRTGRNSRRPRALSVADVDLLRARLAANAAAVRRDQPGLVDLLLGTGLRIGEACALRPANVDLAAGTVTVTGTVIRQPGRGLPIQDVPKTGAGRRTIPIPPGTVELLRRRLAALPPHDRDPVVFPSPNGHLRDPNNTSGDLRQPQDRRGHPPDSLGPRSPSLLRRLTLPGVHATEVTPLTGAPAASRGAGQVRVRSPSRSHPALSRTTKSRASCDSGEFWLRPGGIHEPLTCGVAPPIGLEPITLRLPGRALPWFTAGSRTCP